jgi:uncharacterized membrane protein YbhN (UPF0104 family)
MNYVPDARVYFGVAGSNSTPVGPSRAVRRVGPLALRVGVGVTVLWFLWRQVGAAAFENGLRTVTWQAVIAAALLTVLTTVCSAWRWQVVARALDLDIGLPRAVGAYYRSLFLNSVLVGGVIGDVHRAVAHGRGAGDVGRGVRAVAWERLFGQVVQALATVVVLLMVQSPLRSVLPYLLAGVAVIGGCAALIVQATARRKRSLLGRTAWTVSVDLRRRLLVPDVWPRLVLASVLVVAGHTGVFLIAARTAGSAAPVGELVALLLVVQTAMVIPLGIGGWGLREGAAAWAFGAAGLGAAIGVSAAVLYAVLMLIAVAPGAAYLVCDALRHPHDHKKSGKPGRLGPAPRTVEAVSG